MILGIYTEKLVKHVPLVVKVSTQAPFKFGFFWPYLPSRLSRIDSTSASDESTNTVFGKILSDYQVISFNRMPARAGTIGDAKLRFGGMAGDQTGTIGDAPSNVRRLRIAAGLSQAELAERMGVDHAYVSGLELGQRNPTVLTLWHIAKALGVQVRPFFDEEKPRRRVR
jgi:DNA-binding XRE family transcriptional regulator